MEFLQGAIIHFIYSEKIVENVSGNMPIPILRTGYRVPLDYYSTNLASFRFHYEFMHHYDSNASEVFYSMRLSSYGTSGYGSTAKFMVSLTMGDMYYTHMDYGLYDPIFSKLQHLQIFSQKKFRDKRHSK